VVRSTRGGRRRRFITADDANVFCSGRWGRKRVRVSQCWAIVRAEDAYTTLLRDGSSVQPGWRGELRITLPDDISHSFAVRVVPNAVWRNGRVFLVCPWCARQCTRLYLPLKTSSLRCRTCWGLTYSSRQYRNYKDTGPRWARGLFDLRQMAYCEADSVRLERQRTCQKRWAERRFLRLTEASLAKAIRR
jgi:hypothetical protein